MRGVLSRNQLYHMSSLPPWCYFPSSHHSRHEMAKTSPKPTEILGMNQRGIEIGTPHNVGTVNSIIFSVNVVYVDS